MCILNLILSMLFEGLAFLPIPRALDRAACSLRSCCEHSQAAGFGDRYFGHNKDRQTSVDHIRSSGGCPDGALWRSLYDLVGLHSFGSLLVLWLCWGLWPCSPGPWQ